MRIAALAAAGLLTCALATSPNVANADDAEDYTSGFGLVIVVKYGDKERGEKCIFIDKKDSKYEYKYGYPKKIEIKTPGESDQAFVKCHFYHKHLKYEKEEHGFPCKKVVKYGDKKKSYLTYKSSWEQGNYKGELSCHFNDRKDDHDY